MDQGAAAAGRAHDRGGESCSLAELKAARLRRCPESGETNQEPEEIGFRRSEASLQCQRRAEFQEQNLSLTYQRVQNLLGDTKYRERREK